MATNKGKTATAGDTTKTAPEKVEVRLCKVLKQGLVTRAGTAAQGAQIRLKKEDAEMFEKDGKVQIIGVG